LKTRVGVISDKFFRSGFHKGDEKSQEGINEWVIQFSNGDMVGAYAFVCLPLYLLKTGMGKFMPPSASRDTGFLSSITPELASKLNEAEKSKRALNSAKRKEQRQKKRLEFSNDGNDSNKEATATSKANSTRCRSDDENTGEGEDDLPDTSSSSADMLAATKISAYGLLLSLPEYQKASKRHAGESAKERKMTAKRLKVMKLLEASLGISENSDEDEPVTLKEDENMERTEDSVAQLSFSVTGTPSTSK